MIEALIGIAIGVIAYHRLFGRNGSTEEPGLPSVSPQLPQAPRFRLNIADSLPYTGSLDFVSNFGLLRQTVREVRFFKGPATEASLPFSVRDCLRQAYAAGDVRGPEVAGLIGAQRELKQDEAVYFVLVENGAKDVHLVGLVDRFRGD